MVKSKTQSKAILDNNSSITTSTGGWGVVTTSSSPSSSTFGGGVRMSVDPRLVVERFGKEVVERYYDKGSSSTNPPRSKKVKIGVSSKANSSSASGYVKKQSVGPILKAGGGTDDSRIIVVGTNQISREIQKWLASRGGNELTKNNNGKRKRTDSSGEPSPPTYRPKLLLLCAPNSFHFENPRVQTHLLPMAGRVEGCSVVILQPEENAGGGGGGGGGDAGSGAGAGGPSLLDEVLFSTKADGRNKKVVSVLAIFAKEDGEEETTTKAPAASRWARDVDAFVQFAKSQT
jgi:hypothetical protein